MREIIELDDALSNKIAAGEVVERPASVVKELVENAIDANSSVIEIDIEEAGLGKIRVLDNGKGISPEDILTAFKRHATSKIKDENDLFRIRTLGFRGEALPSIASVSHLEITSAPSGSHGTKAVLEGGKLITSEHTNGRTGTDIEVTQLFYNTPARLKYLKTVHTEIGHITDMINRMALSNPHVSFRLRHHDRVLLQTNGNGDVLQVLAAIYGLAIAKKMVKIEAQSLDFSISGYISLPEVTRASRNYLSTMINGRFIKNYALVKAVLEGYHTLLPIGRFPIALLSIQMDPILVDVNVHPAKMEVRISKEQELFQLIAETVKSVFKKRSLIPDGPMPTRMPKPHSEQTRMELEQHPYEHKRPEQVIRKEEPPTQPIQAVTLGNEELYEAEQEMKDTVAMPKTIYEAENVTERAIPATKMEITSDEPRIAPLYPVGQMHGTYIFAQNDEGLYIIDQHAAQERIKYEYFREKVGMVENELQDMFIPITLEFSSDDFIKIQEHEQDLAKVGVFLEEFGMNSYIVRAHPQWFPSGMEQEIIESMIEQVLKMKKVDIKKLREEAAIMMSCKASIKANRHLRTDEIQSLLDDLRRAEDPFTCPHGRPIIIHYSVTDMEKMFKRIM